MGKELIDLDDDDLAKAAELYGTENSTQTVRAALHDAAERRRRLAAYDRLRELMAGPEFDYLLDKRNYRR